MLSGILLCVIVFALIFEFINGFHDTANAIATSVYTRALTPKKAIALAAAMNLVGAMVSEKVALTISSGLVNITLEQYVILGALIGAIIWNLITWWKGIPSSSSHALKEVFGDKVPPVSSTKGATGHIMGAGGITEIIACIQTIRTGMLPPTLGLVNPDPQCDLDYIPGKARHADINVAMSNSFGFGGQNSSVIIKRYVK